ncbi:MAG: hypothetical protein IT208_02540 [Chthonomonadales bacterium]|nr:hypothetical protein [Chthonomonadales bacterium]
MGRPGALGALLAATVMAAPADGDPHYRNAALGCAFDPPAGWARVRHAGAVAVFIRPGARAEPARRVSPGETTMEFLSRAQRVLRAPPARPGFRPNVTFTARPAPSMSLAEFGREMRRRIARLRGVRVVRETRGELGGAPALIRTVRAWGAGPATLTRTAYCIRGARLFVLALTMRATEPRRLAAAFAKLHASFAWKR